MNDTQVTKRKIGRMIAKNLIVMLVAVIVALTGVLAWFSSKTSAEANGISVECKAPDGVEIAIVEHGGNAPSADDYKTTIELNSENYPFLKNLYMTEVTGDGINGNFSRPALTQVSGKAEVDTTAQWSEASENSDFLSFDLYIKSKGAHTIALDSSSSIAPVNKNNLTWVEGTAAAAYNPSAYGNFSRDCIVGAVRFSVVSTTNTRQLLWIPAPNIKLSGDSTSVETRYTSGSTYRHNYYNTSKEYKTLDNADVVANYSHNDPYKLGKISDITTLKPESDNYYYNHVTCNLWIEGEDDESRLALVGGKYTVTLSLILHDSANN